MGALGQSDIRVAGKNNYPNSSALCVPDLNASGGAGNNV